MVTMFNVVSDSNTTHIETAHQRNREAEVLNYGEPNQLGRSALCETESILPTVVRN